MKKPSRKKVICSILSILLWMIIAPAMPYVVSYPLVFGWAAVFGDESTRRYFDMLEASGTIAGFLGGIWLAQLFYKWLMRKDQKNQ